MKIIFSINIEYYYFTKILNLMTFFFYSSILMDKTRETISRENTYKAFLLYGLVGGCCLVNIINYMETIKFNKELQNQIKFCKKMIEKKNKINVET